MMHRSKSWVAPFAVLAPVFVTAAVLAGCSSSSSSSSTSPSSSPASTGSSASASATGSTSAGLTKAQSEVAALSAVTTKYPVPTASVSGVSALKGKTVYYVPLVAAIPGFAATAVSMKASLAVAGLKQQVCDGQGQPSVIAACVGQATGAGAAGIILDAIPFGMAQNALTSASAKGIPIIVADQYPPTTTAMNTDAVTYVPGVVDQPSQIAWWIIASSGGKANAIIAQEVDSPSSKQYVTNSLSIYKQYCPGCTIDLKTITASTNSLLASATSANILANPNATYYYTEFEDSLQPTIQGIQQSSRTNIALSVAGGSTDGLGLLKSGSSVVKAVVTVDEAYAAWALTDELLRMITKSAPVAETYVSRLFTTQNIGTIQVTPAAENSGAWFGDTSYQSAFAKLWGKG
jgi:ribose transport system substrate-binding protein